MAQKILLIDDDNVNNALLRFALTEGKYDVIFASDPEEGYRMFESEQPDLIVLDIQMPKMNGYEFMEKMKSNYPDKMIPVIMLTGVEKFEDIFVTEGVRGYYRKPVDIKELCKKIEQCLKET